MCLPEVPRSHHFLHISSGCFSSHFGQKEVIFHQASKSPSLPSYVLQRCRHATVGMPELMNHSALSRIKEKLEEALSTLRFATSLILDWKVAVLIP